MFPNLSRLKKLRDEFGDKVEYGFQDHIAGGDINNLYVCLVSLGYGVKYIEKHITLNKKLKGPDHSASLEPKEFIKFVEDIRATEEILGSHQKTPTKSEMKNINHARKVIVASRSISKGDKFNLKNVTVKRAGAGLSPLNWDKVIGSRAKKNYRADQKISIN